MNLFNFMLALSKRNQRLLNFFVRPRTLYLQYILYKIHICVLSRNLSSHHDDGVSQWLVTLGALEVANPAKDKYMFDECECFFTRIICHIYLSTYVFIHRYI